MTGAHERQPLKAQLRAGIILLVFLCRLPIRILTALIDSAAFPYDFLQGVLSFPISPQVFCLFLLLFSQNCRKIFAHCTSPFICISQDFPFLHAFLRFFPFIEKISPVHSSIDAQKPDCSLREGKPCRGN